MRGVILLATLLLLPLTVMAENNGDTSPISTRERWKEVGHPEWADCHTDDQCTMVSTGGCSTIYAVNKNDLAEAQDIANHQIEDCRKGIIHTQLDTLCLNSECVLLPHKE